MKKNNWTSLCSFLTLIWIILFFSHGPTAFANDGITGILFIAAGPLVLAAAVLCFLRDAKRAKAEQEKAQNPAIEQEETTAHHHSS